MECFTNEQQIKIVDFIRKHFKYFDLDQINSLLDKHAEYKTCSIIWDKCSKGQDKVVAFCRWNIDGDTAHILEFAIDEDYRDKDLMRRTLLLGLQRFPYVKNLLWEREGIRPNGKPVKMSITDFMRLGGTNVSKVRQDSNQE
jgi:hypothetical protein